MVKDRVPLLKTGFNERAPMISPDGQWLAYQSDESGRDEVYVQAFPKDRGKWPVSTGGGSTPVWARNGQQLFYRSSVGMMVVGYKISGAVFEPGVPRLWAATSDLGEWFDLSPDGKRFVTIASAPDDSPSTPVIFVLNFFDELKALASPR